MFKHYSDSMHGNVIRMMVYIEHRNCNRRELQDHLYVLESGPVVDGTVIQAHLSVAILSSDLNL